MRAPPPRFAVFASPHGFGHAARTSAVMAAVHRHAGATFDLFTTVPRWFFDESVPPVFTHHEVECDVGFRQHSALRVDLERTVAALERQLPLDEALVAELAERITESGCGAVLCDIAALGIAVAERAGLPSVLVESFTWPFLYRPYLDRAPSLAEACRVLDGWTARATRRLQATPACEPDPTLEAVAPISREPTRDRAVARAALDLPSEGPVVVVTMGGYAEEMPFLRALEALDSITFVVTGAAGSGRRGNLVLFDNRTPLYMPDLLRAADAVVAKLGYGTLAESWREGLPFARVTRAGFPEMPALEAFADREVPGFTVSGQRFADGAWIDRLPELLAMPRAPHGPGGAEAVADVLLEVAGRR